MGGKASLLLVLGFSVIFMVAGRNYSNMATSTVTNLSNYYIDAKTHTLAVSGSNMVINKVFLDPNMSDQSYNYSLDGGTITATYSTINANLKIKQLLVVGTMSGVSTSIKVVLKPSSFSKYAYFSNTEGNVWWTNKDTVWGPFHTNDNIRINYNPVFYGKVTIGGNEIKSPASSAASYYGGFQKGVNVTIPANGVSSVATMAASGGASTSGQSLVYFEFRGDSIRYKYSSGGAWTYRLASTYAPNGVIYFDNAEVRLKGTVKGRYTIATSGTSNINRGSIYLDDNIVYNTNPKTNPSSTDMLGIVAQKNVWITDNTANNTGGITIHASIYCQNGQFTAQNYSSRPVAGFIDLLGGITQDERGPVGTVQNGVINHGFSKRYRYDDRLLIGGPPSFPGTGTFEVVSWFE